MSSRRRLRCGWRETGITVFLQNGGTIKMAQYMAGHADPRTTKLYDRRRQTRGEVERIRYEKKQTVPEAGENR
jgi:integrase